jgi:hypothetical protein
MQNKRTAYNEFFVEPAYKDGLAEMGLTSLDSVFAFESGKNLTKNNLATHRSRIEFQIHSPATILFLKRYDKPPMLAQWRNFLASKKLSSCAYAEVNAAKNLQALGINVPKMIAWGQQFGMIFEKRSFVTIEKIPEGVSLERGLPEFYNSPPTFENVKSRRDFIRDLALFIRKFHDTGYRHRDLYFSHIFWASGRRFYLIDLARTFKPVLFGKRFRVKDLAQLNYSAPKRYFSNTDRMRFYVAYAGNPKMTPQDKNLIKKIIQKTRRIARHDSKKIIRRITQ